MDDDNRHISWRDYVDTRLDALDKALNAALSTSDRALLKAENANEKRFDAVNEFRAALADKDRLLMPRAEAEKLFEVLAEKINIVNQNLLARENKGIGLKDGWVALLSLAAVIIALFAALHR